jgi:hypothetical protein
MTVHSVTEPTGFVGSGVLLQNLNQRNYFTLKREHVDPVYEYHPLFREFLLTRAELMFGSDELGQLRRKAAALLEADGQIEEAVELLQAPADAQALARLIVAHAADFIFEQGRYKVIEAWLRYLPEEMGLGPVFAIPKALKMAGLKLSDIDVIELNEAFAAQSLAVIQQAELDPERVNPNGGAIALGHPLGCTGAKLTATIIREMKRRNAKYGLVTMCVGGGMGAAGIFENLS